MAAVAVTQTQTRPARGTGKRGNNRGRAAPRGAGQPRAARPADLGAEKTEEEAAAATPAATEEPAGTEDVAVCWICAELVKYYAVSDCNHRTCHVCALRLRALYKNDHCTFCKEPQPSMVFTPSADTSFASYDTEKMPWSDAKLSIYFETQEMMEETLLLLRFNCPDAECTFIGSGWSDIKLHVRAAHGRLMCDLCIRNKKVFAHEHALYPPNILPLHLPSMLSNARSNKSFGKGKDKDQIEGGVHPLCEFCRECFFGDDELYAHMREAHEECFICKRQNVRDQYFLNYAAMEGHFTNDHYPCTHTTCLARKFVVFGSALDLKAHAVEEHGGELGKGGLRDARRVEAGWDEVRAGPRQGHGRGRGRERDRDRERERDGDPPPHLQPAPQRPLGGGGRRREGFGASLTVEGESTAAAAPAQVPTPSPPPSRADVDPAVAERHSAFLARLASLAPHPTTALPVARAAIRSFRASESSARDLISTLWSVVDARMEAASSIVNSLVDLLEEHDQREAILAAWCDFEVEQRQQFPDLVPVAVGSGFAGITSGRVLNAKHATTGRGGRPGAALWDRVAQAASSSQRFPTLTAAAGSSAAAARPGQRSTPWSASGAGRSAATAPAPTGFAASSSFVPSPRGGTPVPAVTPFSQHAPAAGTGTGTGAGTGARPPKLSSAAFPELPARQKAAVPVRGNVSLKNITGGTTPAAWGAGGSGAAGAGAGGGAAPAGEPAEDLQDAAAVAGGGKKKGKGKNKQTLFTLGTFPS
ncbi:hypothetical protein GGX14DRAFT_611193 [Mycena pura]|uniref:RING-type E3 ubiquitin transferase n=1 Tax=Mycena pura TaxID=153505 RepID=A0AAD6Y0P8_9AGAR|nr:hypothetical protein GGX14DRAFT_611193 [Mycena pura]